MAARTGEPPEPNGWVDAAEAADVLGLATSYVAGGVLTGRFPVVRHGGAAWMRRSDLEQVARQRAEERKQWASRAEIEQLAGCSDGTVARAISAGEIALRPSRESRSLRSLDRESAEQWAREWRANRAAERRRRGRRLDRESSRPPEDGHVWLDTTTAAIVVGVTENWLRHMAATSRVPVARRGSRWWWRRDLIETFAAARVTKLSRSAEG